MSDPSPVPGRPATLHLLLIALLGLAIAGAVALIVLRQGEAPAQHATTAERTVPPVPSPSGTAPPARPCSDNASVRAANQAQLRHRSGQPAG